MYTVLSIPPKPDTQLTTKFHLQMLKSQKAEVSSFAQYAKTLNAVKQVESPSIFINND